MRDTPHVSICTQGLLWLVHVCGSDVYCKVHGILAFKGLLGYAGYRAHDCLLSCTFFHGDCPPIQPFPSCATPLDVCVAVFAAGITVPDDSFLTYMAG